MGSRSTLGLPGLSGVMAKMAVIMVSETKTSALLHTSTCPWLMWLISRTFVAILTTPKMARTSARRKVVDLGMLIVLNRAPEQKKTLPALASRRKVVSVTFM